MGQTLRFNGFRLVDERNDQTLGHGGERDYHNRDDLHSFWIQFPDGVADLSGYAALQHILRVGAIFKIPTDRYDTSTDMESVEAVIVYFYENYPGGIGIAKKLYHVWSDVLEEGIKIANDCDCDFGCPICIQPAKSWNMGNVDLDKVAGTKIARKLIAAAK